MELRMLRRRVKQIAVAALIGVVATLLTPTMATASPSLPAAGPADPEIVGPLAGTDEFDGGSVDPATWSIVRQASASIRVESGALTIDATAGDLYNATNNAQNLMLQDMPDVGSWMVETSIRFAPTTCCQQAGIVMYDDDDNYSSIAFSGRSGGNGRLFTLTETGGVATVAPRDAPISSWATDFILRVVGDGQEVVAYYSDDDGATWDRFGAAMPTAYAQIGLFAMAGTSGAPTLTATYDYFRVWEHASVYSPPTAEADVVPIDWNRFDTAPLTGADAIPATILTNSDEYALTTWWTRQFGAQPSTGPLTFGGTGEHSIRPAAAAAMSLATSLALGTYDEAITGLSRDVAVERVTRLIGSLAAAHWSNRAGGWSGPSSWQGAMWASLTAQAAWFLWDDLDDEAQRMVALMVEAEADRFIDYDVPNWTAADGTVNYPGDSRAEDNSWNSMLLQVAVAMMPDHPRWDDWSQANVLLLLSSFSRPSDVTSDEVVNGSPMSSWIDGWNMEEDGQVINHGMLHPDYMATMVQQLQAASVATLGGGTVPEAALHNMELEYTSLVDYEYATPEYQAPGGTIYIDGSGSVYYPEGTDWGLSRRMQFVAVDAMSAAWGVDQAASADGRYWLELHGADAIAMQTRGTDGATYTAGDDDVYQGREQWVAMHAAWSTLALWVTQNGDPVVSTAAPSALDDAVAPEITVDVDGDQDASGAYVDAAALTIAATDDEAGIVRLESRRNDGVWEAVDGVVELDEGTWLVEVRATDANGNTSSWSHEYVVAPADTGAEVIAGSNRFETAVAVSQRAFADGAPVVYLVSGTSFPDALSAGPAAAYDGGPVLLTQRGDVPDSVVAEIERLAPDRIMIVGGTAAVSSAVEAELSVLADSVERIAGVNRYETSALVATHVFGAGADTAYIANGREFVDALSAGAAAASVEAPLLLVDGRSPVVPASVAAALEELDVLRLRVVGGTTQVSTATVGALIDLGPSVRRVWGATRYDTSVAVNGVFTPEAPIAYLASGESFPDALAGTAAAGAEGAPLYITRGDCVPQSVLDDLERLGDPDLVVLGGASAIGPGVLESTACQ